MNGAPPSVPPIWKIQYRSAKFAAQRQRPTEAMTGDRRAGRMTRTAFVAARAPSLRVCFVLVGLLALMIQSLVVQTHVHRMAGWQPVAKVSTVTEVVSGAAVIDGDSKATPQRDPYPAGQDPSNCPLCQEFAQFGQYTHAVTILLALLLLGSAWIPIFEQRPSFATVTHTWQGRAPPSQSAQF